MKSHTYTQNLSHSHIHPPTHKISHKQTHTQKKRQFSFTHTHTVSQLVWVKPQPSPQPSKSQLANTTIHTHLLSLTNNHQPTYSKAEPKIISKHHYNSKPEKT